MKILKYIFILILLSGLVFAQDKSSVVPDEQLHKAQFNFNGAWMPNVDPTEIGPNNFRTLQNLRYGEFHPEGVKGYDNINTTALTTYTKLRNGIQLRSDRTQETYVLVQAYNSGLTASKVYENQTAIPDQGDFEATALHTDGTGAGLGRFAHGPNNHVLYTNGVESKIWAGEETRLGALFLVKDTSNTHPIDYTEEANNTLSDANNIFTIGVSDEKVTNGSMEADSNWASEGTPTTQEQSTTQKYSGSYSRKFTVDAADEGIESDTFTSVAGSTYYYGAWVYSDDTANVNVRIRNGANDADSIDTDHTVTQDTWTFVSGSYTEAAGKGGAGAYINFRSPTGEAAGTWYIDDASITITGHPFALVFSTRPIKAIKFDVETANTVKSTLIGYYWSGSAFTAVDSPSDGTASGSVALAQDGTYSFTSTVGSVEPYHLDGIYLYAYRLHLTLGNATIQHMSVDAPFQSIVDIWDGVYRQPIQFQFDNNTVWEDYTLEVNTPSDAGTEIDGDISAFSDSTDSLIIAAEERLAGIRFEMIEAAVNSNASVMTVSYWNGDAYTSVGSSMTDGTVIESGKTLSGTGLVYWSPPAITSEHPKYDFGTYGYFYEITVDSLLSATVKVDLITCIPAQTTVKPFKFPSSYKSRVLLCGFTEGKEGNRCDYSMTYAPDVYNGLESSMDGFQSLYFGGGEDLTTGTQLYNRYGSNVFTFWIAFKDNETYMLSGDGPEDFKIRPISLNVGCPAPLTLASAEVGFELAQGVQRNVAIWLSSFGPYAFDGAVMFPIKGVENYFDSRNSECINFDSIEVSRGWYDPSHKEYNLLIPSGSTQTTNNAWLVYDIPKRKWFEKTTGTASMPQLGFQVVDEYGTTHIYGGIDTGYLMRLEYSNSWDGTSIAQTLITGDFWPTGSVWDKTRIRQLKLIAQRIDEEHTVNAIHLSDTESAIGSDFYWEDTDDFEWTDTDDFEWTTFALPEIEMRLDVGNERLVRSTIATNLLGWSHAFRFETTTSDSTYGFIPIGWGIEYQYVRDDL